MRPSTKAIPFKPTSSSSINKQLLQRFLYFVVSHAIWVAICSASLVFQTMQLMHLPVNFFLIAFVFCATLCSYNFHYILGSAFTQQKFTLRLFTSRYSALLVLAGGITGALLLFNGSGISLHNAVIAAALTFTYSIPLLPFQATAFTRRAGFAKTILLAFTWMFVTAWLPLAESGSCFSETGILLMTKRFLFMLMLCILFDNRDIAVDKVRGLSSLATHLSAVQMKWLLYCIFGLLFLINYLLGQHGVSGRQVAALQLAAFINLVIYFFSLKKQGYIFYYFIVDGSMLLMTMLTTVASI